MSAASFEVQRLVANTDTPKVARAKHLFVAGLARAGTTILMRRLYETGRFRSLTYRDMPFVLMPDLWGRIRGRAPASASVERAHGDGIMVNNESPEALEEVFWRVHFGSKYIRPDRLKSCELSAEAVSQFREYLAILLTGTDSGRYLSKNNNNILRLRVIAAAFPNAVQIVPFREPRSHAASLLRQHRRFLRIHAESRFSRQYMRWLVHHEFGADHRPFEFDPATVMVGGDRLSLGYWMRQWVHVYRGLLDTAPPSAVFVCYEDLCREDNQLWMKLTEILELPVVEGSDVGGFVSRNKPCDESLPEGLEANARDLYEVLQRRQVERLSQ
ncbi:sulfotransferase [Stratiformator vulcanicus]|uniref:sulfotransferase n=1 Tax=Stratiformator vulcanicus TaxID=2527980 RepID=UPI0011A3555C|nr:sulfotransferase [Stratiformator vulcanicus]